jgi:RNA polymerase sigma factor (sigma-70 family)
MSTALYEPRRPAGALDPADADLVARFALAGDEAAFGELVRRHGPMVLGVCRRLLPNRHDAEDAFQATFLLLARNAAAIRKRDAVGSWLYGTAYRVASRARGDAARRRAREGKAAAAPVYDPRVEAAWRELRPILDDELNRLPEKYRRPLVLCYLQGLTNAEAARLLGWTKGTVSGRLARARDLLRARLKRRGVGPECCLFLLLLRQSALLTKPLAACAVALATVARLGGAGVPPRVLALAAGSARRRAPVLRRLLVPLLLLALGLALTATAAASPWLIDAAAWPLTPRVITAPSLPAPPTERPDGGAAAAPGGAAGCHGATP